MYCDHLHTDSASCCFRFHLDELKTLTDVGLTDFWRSFRLKNSCCCYLLKWSSALKLDFCFLGCYVLRSLTFYCSCHCFNWAGSNWSRRKMIQWSVWMHMKFLLHVAGYTVDVGGWGRWGRLVGRRGAVVTAKHTFQRILCSFDVRLLSLWRRMHKENIRVYISAAPSAVFLTGGSTVAVFVLPENPRETQLKTWQQRGRYMVTQSAVAALNSI